MCPPPRLFLSRCLQALLQPGRVWGLNNDPELPEALQTLETGRCCPLWDSARSNNFAVKSADIPFLLEKIDLKLPGTGYSHAHGARTVDPGTHI